MEVPPPFSSAPRALFAWSGLAPARVCWPNVSGVGWLILSLALLVCPGPAVSARVSSSLSTTHHVHHFHNKHGTVPIAINRMPFLTRGSHGKSPADEEHVLDCVRTSSIHTPESKNE